ncbi:hypothetical protein POV27_17745 [Aureisphaera galaxeae]|uniref:hypothetical protein n=1 Tax=Aureisphaera galaxeae TaxID=1538023 RepID=UPI0023501AB5|nr:hypothetical protein [Aureisphaera galaxeae]MDC8005901.1 hypothetical protein [Aureisphaera galaxeae]
MKRLLLFSIPFLLFACSNDDVQRGKQKVTLKGSYVMIEGEMETPMDINGDGVASTNLMEELPNCVEWALNLSSNFFYSYRTNEVAEVNGGLEFNCFFPHAYSSGIWTEDGDVLVLFDRNDGMEYRWPYTFEGVDLRVQRTDTLFGNLNILFDRTTPLH